jgi:hypothetical protein
MASVRVMMKNQSTERYLVWMGSMVRRRDLVVGGPRPGGNFWLSRVSHWVIRELTWDSDSGERGVVLSS